MHCQHAVTHFKPLRPHSCVHMTQSRWDEEIVVVGNPSCCLATRVNDSTCWVQHPPRLHVHAHADLHVHAGEQPGTSSYRNGGSQQMEVEEDSCGIQQEQPHYVCHQQPCSCSR